MTFDASSIKVGDKVGVGHFEKEDWIGSIGKVLAINSSGITVEAEDRTRIFGTYGDDLAKSGDLLINMAELECHRARSEAERAVDQAVRNLLEAIACCQVGVRRYCVTMEKKAELLALVAAIPI